MLWKTHPGFLHTNMSTSKNLPDLVPTEWRKNSSIYFVIKSMCCRRVHVHISQAPLWPGLHCGRLCGHLCGPLPQRLPHLGRPQLRPQEQNHREPPAHDDVLRAEGSHCLCPGHQKHHVRSAASLSLRLLQCCGSGSKLDPYSAALWVRIQSGSVFISFGLGMDSYSEYKVFLFTTPSHTVRFF